MANVVKAVDTSVMDLKGNDLAEWLKNKLGITPVSADCFRDHRIIGSIVFKKSEQDLRDYLADTRKLTDADDIEVIVDYYSRLRTGTHALVLLLAHYSHHLADAPDSPGSPLVQLNGACPPVVVLRALCN